MISLAISGETSEIQFVSQIYAEICGIFYKNVLPKKTFRMQLRDYIKTMILDFINKGIRCLIFNSFIGSNSFKNCDRLDIIVKDAMVSRNRGILRLKGSSD